MAAAIVVVIGHDQTSTVQSIPAPLAVPTEFQEETGPEASRGTTGLSPFGTRKVEELLGKRLPCLGCHRLGDDGGMIGPDLTGVGARRSPEFIRAMIRDPQETWPGTAMPRTPMPARTLDLLTTYLLARQEPGVARRATDPPAAPGGGGTSQSDAPAIYARLCAACHGPRGEGDGFNAAFLPVRPTAHADSAYMSTRPDDALYDAIAVGGYIMNRSNHMPVFGFMLSGTEIRDLVGHLRKLCRCEGPVWSRDGTRDGR